MKKRKSRPFLILFTTVALALAGCSRLPLYSQFQPVDVDGWERADSLRFVIPVSEPGSYALNLHLRTTNHYPYTRLSLLVHCHDKGGSIHRVDTLTLDIAGSRDQIFYRGTGIHEYSLPLPPVTIRHSPSTIHITVAHYMTHEALPGISDVGFTAEAQ